jgi:hypothetical protein
LHIDSANGQQHLQHHVESSAAFDATIMYGMNMLAVNVVALPGTPNAQSHSVELTTPLIQSDGLYNYVWVTNLLTLLFVLTAGTPVGFLSTEKYEETIKIVRLAEISDNWGFSKHKKYLQSMCRNKTMSRSTTEVVLICWKETLTSSKAKLMLPDWITGSQWTSVTI